MMLAEKLRNMQVEYQIVIDRNGDVCTSIKSLKTLLQLNERIAIKGKLIEFEKSKFNLDVQMFEVASKNQLIYTTTFKATDQNKIEKFTNLLKLIRSLFEKVALSVSILWDDISLHYSDLSYPKIWKSENLLRKLIYKFMVESIGRDWTNEGLPDEFKSSISSTKTKDRTANRNILHKADFIQLSDFLFKPYSKKSHTELYKYLNNNREDVQFDSLTEFIPKSNWKKYFNASIDCEDQEFEKKWKRLYDLRCLIAHNNFFTQQNYEEVDLLCTEIDAIIINAIGVVKDVEIPKSDIEDVAENLAKNSSEVVAKFFNGYELLIELLLEYIEMRNDLNEEDMEFVAQRIKEGNTLSKRFKIPSISEINAVSLTRKHLISNSNLTPKDETLARYNNSLDDIIQSILDEIDQMENIENNSPNNG